MRELDVLAAKVASELLRRKYQVKREGRVVSVLLAGCPLIDASMTEADLEKPFDEVVNDVEAALLKYLDGHFNDILPKENRVVPAIRDYLTSRHREEVSRRLKALARKREEDAAAR